MPCNAECGAEGCHAINSEHCTLALLYKHHCKIEGSSFSAKEYSCRMKSIKRGEVKYSLTIDEIDIIRASTNFRVYF